MRERLRDPRVLLTAFGAVIVLFLFYWFQLRPIYVYRGCVERASADARKLLGTKYQLTDDQNIKKQYESLIMKNMYLRADFDSFLRKCLLYYGMSPNSAAMPQMEETGLGE